MENINYKALEEIARKYNVNALINDGKISVSQPNSMEEAKALSGFWEDAFGEIKDSIKQVEFVYQEKDKEIPLSYSKRFIKNLGFKVKAKKEEGEIKYESIKPEAISNVNSSARIITNKKEWEKLNDIAQNSETFSAPYVFAPANLCYRVNVPLECIVKVELNELGVVYK